ncbi:MAG: hypothetical protein LBG47_10145 [Prevotellaceae bacterium]|jgi:hypothetical protein|nr:hypothetical protein [Prevotellaceae bacterium]
MRTLDLNAYGVYEMNEVEMRDADGGIWFAGWIDVISLGIGIRYSPGVLYA